jgi:hypothetical protein
MGKFEVRVEGMEELQAQLKELAKAYPRETFSALVEEAELLMTDSKKEVNVGNTDVAALKNSGYVKPDEATATVEVGYGGVAAPYAVLVHEGFAPHEIRPVAAQVLAVPEGRWRRGGRKTPNPYGSGQLPSLSKDGYYVILGKKVSHPGYKGSKYLERPMNARMQGMAERIAARVDEKVTGGK